MSLCKHPTKSTKSGENTHIGNLLYYISILSVSSRLNISIIIYILVEEKNTLLSLQACFVIAHSSGDFNDKIIPNHHLNTIIII